MSYSKNKHFGLFRNNEYLELKENGNGQASFDFSLITAFRVVENVSQKYFEEGFGGETAQEKPRKDPRKAQEI
ncbi:hypothetical protein HMPREF1981_03309 [Bacteroides pyogenes F0041]|nr:hypothetical protein [Bacteroides pyogenes]ERI81268.1 hypothetical protein HMPREF1981_03309 [Bacteroides pyogenes F0041]